LALIPDMNILKADFKLTAKLALNIIDLYHFVEAANVIDVLRNMFVSSNSKEGKQNTKQSP
jgi:hypothetical protein